METITGADNLRYVDQLLEKFHESQRMLQGATANPCVAVKANKDGAFSELDVTSWINERFPAETFPQIRRALDNAQRTRSEQSAERRSPCWGDWSDFSSERSVVSSSTTLSEAAFKAHEDSQFEKLLPRENAERTSPLHPLKRSLLGSLRKSLRHKVRMPNLLGPANARFTCVGGVSSQYESCAEPNEEISDKTIMPTKSAPSKKDVERFPTKSEAQHVFSSSRPQKGTIPEGRELVEVQLTLQENILSDIAHQAIEATRKGGKGVKAKGRSYPAASDGEPEDIDRELEVTRELMRQLRAALDDESYQDMYLIDSDGKERSMEERYENLCDVLLMLRRAFQDILARYERAYRPTGFAVTDQEMVREMDKQLLAREKLMQRYPMMAIEEMLESFGGIGREADLKTLAGL